MTPFLLDLLCDPATGEPLSLREAEFDNNGNIVSGLLFSPSGNTYSIRGGIPRFADNHPALRASVTSFGDEWNHFNFIDFKTNWLSHTVKNTFGDPEYFSGRIVVDAGGGSGSQTKWFSEYGAKHVIMLDLSHSVDDVAQRNLRGLPNVDVIQCSIDAPPIRANSIDGIVYCHNVIQHTPSVERTARALFNIVAPGGEFVFNCYQLNDSTPLRWVRFHLIQKPLRAVLSRTSFGTIRCYAGLMGRLRLVPFVGSLLEKSGIAITGDVPFIAGETHADRRRRIRKSTELNTFDGFGSHAYQHHIPDAEMRTLIKDLQPNASKVRNADAYFSRPPPIGVALRLSK